MPPAIAGREDRDTHEARAEVRRTAVLRAADLLRSELGAHEGLGRDAVESRRTSRGVVEASVSKAGHLDGLWGWRPGGLAVRRAGETFEQAFVRFIGQHRALFLLDDP